MRTIQMSTDELKTKCGIFNGMSVSYKEEQNTDMWKKKRNEPWKHAKVKETSHKAAFPCYV